MAVLNHTIAQARDKTATARFYSEMFGFDPPVSFGPFAVVRVSDDTTIDFIEYAGEFESQHYAFLVTEPEFDEIFARIIDRGITYWADPGRAKTGQINHRDDGRGAYFPDPNDHLLEILTRPYGSGADDPDPNGPA